MQCSEVLTFDQTLPELNSMAIVNTSQNITFKNESNPKWGFADYGNYVK